MATPSITMIPSGYKSQKVYSVLPTNGDGDLTFDRTTTATRVNKNGLIEQVATDIPRLDYSDGSCPSLLSEPASLNLALYSEDFSQWTKSEINGTSTIISSSQLSPSGTNNAYRVNCVLDDNTLNNEATFRASNVSGLTSSNRTVSFYLRSDTSSEVMVRSPYNNGTYTTFQLTNNWERYSISATNPSATTCLIEIGLRAITGFGDTNLNATFDVWGAQLEEQPYATSYIPTTSETASRSADWCSKTGLSSYISSTAGVLYAEIASLSSEDESTRIFSLNDGGNINRVFIGFLSSGRTYAAINNQPVAYFTPTDPTVFHKVAIKYEDNNTKFFANGNQIGSTETTQTVPNGLNQVKFNDGGATSNRFYGKVKDLRVYNTSLTDLELQTLTTI